MKLLNNEQICNHQNLLTKTNIMPSLNLMLLLKIKSKIYSNFQNENKFPFLPLRKYIIRLLLSKNKNYFHPLFAIIR